MSERKGNITMKRMMIIVSSTSNDISLKLEKQNDQKWFNKDVTKIHQTNRKSEGAVLRIGLTSVTLQLHISISCNEDGIKKQFQRSTLTENL